MGGATSISFVGGLLKNVKISQLIIVAGGGGGGGLYGGGAGYWYGSSAGGGSGYIGNELLTNKEMYCYSCSESTDPNTKTTSTEDVSDTPISNYAKKGPGHARITYLG